MKNEPITVAQKRKGVFYLILPLILVPFLLLFSNLFFPASATEQPVVSGLNQQIPEPILENDQEGKSGAYSFLEKSAQEDKSANWEIPSLFSGKENPETLPELYPEKFRSSSRNENQKMELPTGQSFDRKSNSKALSTRDLEDPEQAIIQKMEELDKLIKANESLGSSSSIQVKESRISSKASNREIEQLQEMFDTMESKPYQKDPELEQLDQLMDKILDLQYPERIRQKNSLPDPIDFPIGMENKLIVSEAGNHDPELESNGFYGLENFKTALQKDRKKSFHAVVAENQEILPGQILLLELTENLSIGELNLPSNSVLHATTQLSGDRLLVSISGVYFSNQFYPLKLAGYGLDAVQGIPLATVRGGVEILDQSQNQALNFNMGGVGMGLEAQLANAGLNAGRSLVRSKGKSQKLMIKSGHPLILIDFSTN